MKLSQTNKYAIVALIAIAENKEGRQINCNKICEQNNLPGRFVLQILRNMVAQGILSSSRGVAGGYSLAKPANEITLLNIFEAIDGTITREEGPSKEFSESLNNHLQGVMGNIKQNISNSLNEITLQNLIDANSPHDQPLHELN